MGAELGGVAALQALEPEWTELLARCPEVSPFGSPAWLIPWAQSYAPDRCGAITVRDSGRLVALAPVFTWQGALYLAGSGPSDYGEVLVEPGRDRLGAELLSRLCALAVLQGCHLVDLQQLRPESPLAAAPAPQGWAETRAPGEVCPVAPIAGTDGLGAMVPDWRKKLDYARRRLGREASLAYELATTQTLPGLWSDLQRLHARRWESRGEPGVLADPLAQAHLTAALPALMQAGLLRLHALRVDGAVAAAILALQDTRRTCVYITAFDPDQARWSPGALLWARLIETAANEGASETHFLRGREAYKYHWGAMDRPTVRRTLRPA